MTRNRFGAQQCSVQLNHMLRGVICVLQAMVFVHSRKETGRTAWALLNVANVRCDACLEGDDP